MNSRTDQELLREFAARRSETAFAVLMQRHLDFVHSAAMRMVQDTHLAEDVTQAVFVALVRNAGSLANRPVLAGWLHRTAQNIAAQSIRSNVRRRAREQEASAMKELTSADAVPAWEQIAPHLDAALGELSESDRDALLLRYFERKSAREMAQTLRTTEEAAQKRVNRAVERLRDSFIRRGVTIGLASLALISSNAVQAVPAGLAVNVSAAVALAEAALLTTSNAPTTIAITMTSLQKALFVIVVAAGIVTPFVIHHDNQLRQENLALHRQIAQQAQLAAENQRLSKLIIESARTGSQVLSNEKFNELLRLRAEVAGLRLESNELARTKLAVKQSPANQLREELARMPEKNIPELLLLDDKKWSDDAQKGRLDTEEGVREALGNLRRAAKIRFALTLGQTLDAFVRSNYGRLPDDLGQLKPYFNPPVDEAVLQRYELLHAGKLADLLPGEPLIAEKAAVDEQFDTLFQIGADNYTMQGVGKWSQIGFTNTWIADVK